MHELSVAKQVVDLAVETAGDHGAETVDGLTVALGRATHVNPTQLRFCVQTVAEGTPAADAAVSIDRVAPRGRCDCGWAGEPGAIDEAVTYVPDPLCPDCGARVELTRGQGCRLASIDVPATEDPIEDSTPTHE
jgi:hydrogenase nickel incorporation protein HypA/HybF